MSKSCYNCGQEGHLSRDCPAPRVQRGDAAGGANPNVGKTCYNCSGTDHLARDCPHPRQEQQHQPRFPRFNKGGNAHPRRPKMEVEAGGAASEKSVSATKSCYNCGGVDHLARDCPNPRTEDSMQAAANRPRRTRTVKCFSCGDSGHISKDCPQLGMGPRCYKCNQFGHISKACPEVEAAAPATGEAF